MQPKTFLSIEQGLSERLTATWDREFSKLQREVDVAVGDQDFPAATEAVENFSTERVFSANEKVIQFSSRAAYLFGASMVSGKPKNVRASYKRNVTEEDIDPTLVMQNQIDRMWSDILKPDILVWIQTLSEEAQEEETSDLVRVVKQVFKAERAVRPFTSFAATGTGYLQLVSQLHTSRLSGWGFVAEAEVRKITTYRVDEQLDNRICPICRQTHGKTFKVADAKVLLEKVVHTSDPDALRQLQPWPSQSAENVAFVREADEQELVNRGWHIPPYHPWCRGLLRKVEDVDVIYTTPSYVEAGRQQISPISGPQALPSIPGESFLIPTSGPPVISGLNLLDRPITTERIVQAGFTLAGLGFSPEVYRRVYGANLDPTELHRIVRRLPGADDVPPLTSELGTDEIEEIVGEVLTRYPVVRLSARSQDIGFKRSFIRQGDALVVTHDLLSLRKNLQSGGIAKDILSSSFSLYEQLGVNRVELFANIDVGGYAWAKYGFSPTSASAPTLAAYLRDKLNDFDLSPAARAATTKLIDGLPNDPTLIWAISDIDIPMNGSTLGKQLLLGSRWRGELVLKNETAMRRFNAYVGR